MLQLGVYLNPHQHCHPIIIIIIAIIAIIIIFIIIIVIIIAIIAIIIVIIFALRQYIYAFYLPSLPTSSGVFMVSIQPYN